MEYNLSGKINLDDYIQFNKNPYLHSVEIDGMIQAPYSGGAKAHGQEQESQIQKEDAMGRA
jgi:hypothetical protein